MKNAKKRVRLSILVAGGVFALTMSVVLAAFGGWPGGPQAATAEQSSDIQVTFTKWVIGEGPNIAGTVGGAAGVGTLTAELITVDLTVAADRVTEIEAVYHIRGGAHQFEAHFEVRMFNSTGSGYFDGFVTDGWMAGSRIGGEFTSRKCAQGICFDGVMHLLQRDAF